ncbi:MAG: hypothetical protein ACRDHF_05400 [Tepidiformaceae bacterium]
MTAEPAPPAPTDHSGLRPPLTKKPYFELLAELGLDDPEEHERSWQILKAAMNETRREPGQPPVRE